MRQLFALALVAVVSVATATAAGADQKRCAARFPGAEWVTVDIDAPVTVATAGMTPEMSTRFAADVERNANLVQAEIGGLDGAAVCLATPELASVFADFAAPGQRLHVGAFGEEKLLVLSAVEIRMVDDAIAFGLPHIALWQVAEELDLSDGYPEPLGSTIAHWYMARDTGRMVKDRGDMIIALFLDDPNPRLRTIEDASVWVGAAKEDPFFYDPQFVVSQMGVFIEYATTEAGLEVIRDPSQETWAQLENEWRVEFRSQLPEGSFGAQWGVAIIVFFTSLAIVLALLKRRQKRRDARKRPTPPADESLFGESGSS